MRDKKNAKPLTTMLFLMLLGCPPFVSAQAQPVSLPSAIKPPSTGLGYEVFMARLKGEYNGTGIHDNILLAPLDEGEIASIASISKHKSNSIGIGRKVPLLLISRIKPANLDWVALKGGGKVARLTVTSPNALALRIGLTFEKIAEGVELRFFDPYQPDQVWGPFTDTDWKQLKDSTPDHPMDKCLWSPVVAEDTIGLEIYLPDTMDPDGISYVISNVIHIICG